MESETLSAYGDVIRFSIDPRDQPHSHPVKADVENPPVDGTVTLGFFQPPCTRWAQMTKYVKADGGDHPNLIPECREWAEEHCEHYIIENVPAAPLHDPVTLQGDMFGLPVQYKRAFETSYYVEQLPLHGTLTREADLYDWHHPSREWWQSIKGVSEWYPKEHLAKNCVPRAYLDYLLRPLLPMDHGHE